MALFQSLGLNSTFLIQFFIFVLTVIGLYSIAFKAFAQSLEKRVGATTGSESQAEALKVETQKLSGSFEEKAKSINNNIRQIFEASRSETSVQVNGLTTKARAEAEKSILSTRQMIMDEVKAAEGQLAAETKSIAEQLVQKMVGRSV